jgi:hypothetical protein
MAQYMVLIYGDEAQWDARTDEGIRATDAGHRAFAERAGSSILASGELESSGTATTLRAGGERPLVTDGPFLETKEVLGGFYLVEADSLDEAIEWASRIPAATHGTIEVRPVVDHSGNGA